MMRCTIQIGIVVVVVGLIALERAGAQQGKTGTQQAIQPTRSADEAAIRAAAQKFAVAFQTGDDKAISALFTEEAEYVGEGSEPIRGRAALIAAYRELFSKWKELKAEATTDAVRFIGADTAVEEGTFTVTAKGSPPNASRYSTLYVRQRGDWLIAHLKEWQDDTTNQPTLDELDWLIGTWESSDEGVTARTTYSWTANKAFLRADYTITMATEGAKPSSGTQVIGIDPAVGEIRAWLFASDGGIGESIWYWEEDRWVIESEGTLADGSYTSAVNFMGRSGNDAFTWRSVQRIHDGESLPDLNTVTVRRVAASGAAVHSTR